MERPTYEVNAGIIRESEVTDLKAGTLACLSDKLQVKKLQSPDLAAHSYAYKDA